MREDGNKILEEYLKENPEEIKNYAIFHKYENDPRITMIGDFLRRTSLDELPQIINVFRGEMFLHQVLVPICSMKKRKSVMI